MSYLPSALTLEHILCDIEKILNMSHHRRAAVHVLHTQTSFELYVAEEVIGCLPLVQFTDTHTLSHFDHPLIPNPDRHNQRTT